MGMGMGMGWECYWEVSGDILGIGKEYRGNLARILQEYRRNGAGE